DGDERRDQGRQGQRHLDDVPRPPRRERLDEDAEQRRAEHDQHRGDEVVGDRGRVHLGRHQRGGHFAVPSASGATFGHGWVTPTWVMVCLTAGLTTSSTTFGKNPSPMITAITGATTHASRAVRSW